MYTLDNFYQSKQWIKLYTLLRQERTDENGVLKCSFCGKPIVKPYDCIAHHTVFLTEQNVNDASVSLNPDLIHFVHHACHNKIHEKFGYRRQEVFLIYGSPLSGKTSFVNSVSNFSDFLIDVDKIWGSICTAPVYEKPPVLNQIVFGVRDYLLESVRLRRGKWQNAYIVGGYPLVSERERLCRQLGAREIYIESTKDQCMERLERDKDRDKKLWKKYIDDWWDKYSPSQKNF